MRNVFTLLLIIFLVIAGWTNRASLRGFWRGPGDPPPGSTVAAAGSTSPSAPTPDPAQVAQAQAQVAMLYPALHNPDSPLAKKYRLYYEDAKHSDPDLFARGDWPFVLAERAMVALGGQPLPRPAPATPGAQTFQPMTKSLDRPH